MAVCELEVLPDAPARKEATHIMAQRRRSFGTVRSRSKLDKNHRGTWQIQWTDHGRRKAETLHRATRSECVRRLAEIEASITDAPPAPTCAEVWKRFGEESIAKLAPSTRVTYRRVWERDASPRWGSVPVSDVRRGDVQRWLDSMPGGEAAMAKSVLSRVLKIAKKRDYVSSNATEGCEVGTTVREANRSVLSRADVDRLDSACRGSAVEPAYILMCHAGLRTSEARDIKPSDVMWGIVGGSRQLCVSVTKSAAYSKAVEREQGGIDGRTKTRTSVRVAVVCGMQERLWTLAQEASKRGDEYLLDNGFGEPATPEELRKMWNALCDGAGVRRVPPRNLRATFVTLSHDAGIPLEAVKEQVGHSSIAITERVYNRPDVEQRAGQFARELRKIAADTQQNDGASVLPAAKVE